MCVKSAIALPRRTHLFIQRLPLPTFFSSANMRVVLLACTFLRGISARDGTLSAGCTVAGAIFMSEVLAAGKRPAEPVLAYSNACPVP
jgi:hypothetical protein